MLGAMLGLVAAAPPALQPRFEQSAVPDPQGSALEAGIWAPDGDSVNLPLVVISHGSGGEFRNHEDIARALAKAGFVVAAVTHSGDNRHDRSAATAVWERPRHLKLLVDHMLGSWRGRRRIDPARVGAFGFSSGGFTVLVAAGGVPDLGRVREHCRARPALFDCRLSADARRDRPDRPDVDWSHDPRIKAIVAAAPALGFTFSKSGLAKVRVPVQLWRAGADEILPHPLYVEPVRKALPRRADYRVAEGAGHFDFLPPCPRPLAEARPDLCRSAAGFDRSAFHQALAGDIVTFFRRHLTGSRAD